MPTVLRTGPYRFFFYAGDGGEPPHVHVERDDCEAKFWLEPVRLERSHGFARAEIRAVQRLVQGHLPELLGAGMTSSVVDSASATARSVAVTDEAVTVELSDGRSVSAPLAWYPRLVHATATERDTWRLVGAGRGVHWPALDEDISVANLLAGQPSAESQASLARWLSGRAPPAGEAGTASSQSTNGA